MDTLVLDTLFNPPPLLGPFRAEQGARRAPVHWDCFTGFSAWGRLLAEGHRPPEARPSGKAKPLQSRIDGKTKLAGQCRCPADGRRIDAERGRKVGE